MFPFNTEFLDVFEKRWNQHVKLEKRSNKYNRDKFCQIFDSWIFCVSDEFILSSSANLVGPSGCGKVIKCPFWPTVVLTIASQSILLSTRKVDFSKLIILLPESVQEDLVFPDYESRFLLRQRILEFMDQSDGFGTIKFDTSWPNCF